MSIDILLVNPIFLSQDEAERELMTPYFPLGLLYLAAFLRSKGIDVAVFDGTFAQGTEAFTAILKDRSPRVVGITAVQPNRDTALALARLAKESGATVILGGPDPTRTPETYLADSAVDFVVHHEGELTLVALLDALRGEEKTSFNHIDGIAYRDESGEVIRNPRRPYILNLDELPVPARDLIDMDQYLSFWRENYGYSSLTISVARGCPYGCEWCAESVHGATFRQRSPESVVAEVKALMGAYDIDRLRLVDDVDGIKRDWFEVWEETAEAEGAAVPFEALNEVKRKDIPMLDIRTPL